jgi:hypothetical protein
VVYDAVASGRRYALVALATANFLYGVRQDWSHAIAWLGYPKFEAAIYDPIAEIDPEFHAPIRRLTFEGYLGKLEAISALVREPS